MRIIAGKFKGKKLKSFEIETTRPTLDRIKEPLFSMLMPYIKDAEVLDLFSGTGSLGLEAISRGAKFAWLNDINKNAIMLISANVQLTGCENYVKITRKDYLKCLKQAREEESSFNIIFLDPPYNSDFELNLLNLILEYKLLKENGVLVLESDKRKLIDENVPGLKLIKKRTYGRVIIRFYELEE